MKKIIRYSKAWLDQDFTDGSAIAVIEETGEHIYDIQSMSFLDRSHLLTRIETADVIYVRVPV